MSNAANKNPQNSRMCHIMKWENFDGYGFNLHAEKGKSGQYIGKVDEGSPAEAAGLRQGDRILEVNGESIANKTHKQVVEAIKGLPDETKLLVVDPHEEVQHITDAPQINEKQIDNNPPANEVENGPLKLNMTAAELRAKLKEKKKFDPKKEAIDFKKNYGVIMDVEDFHSTNSSTRLVAVGKQNSESCGFHLTRSKWDPYPWVSKVDEGTAAQLAGIQPGECVLEVNGEDVVGKRISEIAERVRSGSNQISLLLWNSGVDPRCEPESLCCGSMPQNLQRLSTCMASILAVLECPVCLDTMAPPIHQCENGHLVCLRCRTRTERCPVCRIRLSRGRSLLAEQVHNTISEVFGLREESQQIQKTKMQSIFKLNSKKKNVPDIKITQSHANKLLARIIGKSTSVDNLTNDCRKTTSNEQPHLVGNDFGNSLKAKSLSTSEIFKPNPSNSRTNSFNNINDYRVKYLEKKYLNSGGLTSYQGSMDSVEQSSNVGEIASTEVGVLYPCPYQKTCTTTIKGMDIITHFRDHHEGPLVQYFQDELELPFEILRTRPGICYVIHAIDQTFFLRIVNVEEKCNKEHFSDVILWMWILTKLDGDFQFNLEILSGTEETLMSVNCPTYSLFQIAQKTIVEYKKGIFLNLHMLDQFRASIMRIRIQKFK
ncbi:hypothetical protein FQA39_LY07150 [Lamprigera yunnana]|nr:hypothetical protein FQA39_LY07150 [Lamprigera yunnana]